MQCKLRGKCMNNLHTSPLSSCKNLPPYFFMVHLLHRLYGVDAPGSRPTIGCYLSINSNDIKFCFLGPSSLFSHHLLNFPLISGINSRRLSVKCMHTLISPILTHTSPMSGTSSISSIDSPLSSSVSSPSLFHVWLKTFLFCIPFPP